MFGIQFTHHQAAMHAIFLGLIEVGLAAAHFYQKVPFETLFPILGEKPTAQQQQYWWYILSFLVAVRFIFAAMPTHRTVSQINAAVHCLEVLPMSYLIITNGILMNGGGKKRCPFCWETIVLSAAVGFVWFNASSFYNYWKAGEAKRASLSSSVSRSVSSSSVEVATRIAASSKKKKAAAASPRSASKTKKRATSSKKSK